MLSLKRRITESALCSITVIGGESTYQDPLFWCAIITHDPTKDTHHL